MAAADALKPDSSQIFPLKLQRPYYAVPLGKTSFEVDTRYQGLRPIGRGAYGLVAAAEDVLTGFKVAIKRISRVFTDLIDAKRILREIKLLRHLGEHENVIDILDIMTGPPETEDFHTLYIVTHFFECDLERIIGSSQRLTDQHTQSFIYQVLRGLKFIHSANVLHRDLKPSNLLVNSNCTLAICDFGLARGTIDPSGGLTEYVVTRWYRAPELLCERPDYGPPVDIWSVGCIFAEIIGRKPLFKGNSSREQLELIIKVVGSPSAEDLRSGAGRQALDFFQRLGTRQPIPLQDLYPQASPLALDLLGKMLTFSPLKRITIDEALNHPYLCDQHGRSSEPVCVKAFDSTFETHFPDEMPKALLQRLMIAELLGVRAQWAKSCNLASLLPIPPQQPRAASQAAPTTPEPAKAANFASSPTAMQA